MPRTDGLPAGTQVLLILRIPAEQPLHGYVIPQRIARRSNRELSVEVKAAPAVSDLGRPVRIYRVTRAGCRRLEAERAEYARVSRAIVAVLEGI